MVIVTSGGSVGRRDWGVAGAGPFSYCRAFHLQFVVLATLVSEGNLLNGMEEKTGAVSIAQKYNF